MGILKTVKDIFGDILKRKKYVFAVVEYEPAKYGAKKYISEILFSSEKKAVKHIKRITTGSDYSPYFVKKRRVFK